MKCLNCNNEINENEQKCNYCGYELKKMKYRLKQIKKRKFTNWLIIGISIFIYINIVFPMISPFFKYNKIQYKKNALDYVRKKYNIEAKIEKVTLEKKYLIVGSEKTGFACVEMEYNGKKFYVYINNEKNNYSGYDNYQYELITKKILEIVKEDTNLDYYDYNIDYSEVEFQNSSLEYVPGIIKKYYDGTNIKEVLALSTVSLNVDYIGDNNLQNIDLKKTLDCIYMLEARLVNYSSIDNYNKAHAYESLQKSYEDNDFIYAHYADIYKDNTIYYYSNYYSKKKYTYNYKNAVKELDGILFYSPAYGINIDVSKQQISWDFKFPSIKKLPNIDTYQITYKYFLQENEEKSLDFQIGDLYVFIPKSKLTEYEQDDFKRSNIELICKNSSGEFSTGKKSGGVPLDNYYGFVYDTNVRDGDILYVTLGIK